MGVPKFYRWLSERYPKITQRHGCRPSAALLQEHFGNTKANDIENEKDDSSATILTAASVAENLENAKAGEATASSSFTTTLDFVEDANNTDWLLPDPLAECGLAPEIDRLYIDMNGIIHGCSHSNNLDENTVSTSNRTTLSQQEIVRNVCYYLDRIVKEIAKPNELLYLAIDGVAPRAKLNQQRGRRYRSGKEGEIEQTIYDAYLQAQQQQQMVGGEAGEDDESLLEALHPADTSPNHPHRHPEVKQVGPGRFAGKFETDEKAESSTTSSSTFEQHGVVDDEQLKHEPPFHSVAITPGTKFLVECSQSIRDFCQDRLAHDPQWQHLTVVFSGADVPGEGEHKILQFIREQQQQGDDDDTDAKTTKYNPNGRHCIMGQDGDLILLGLATHEPNLMLLREQVLFDMKLRRFEELTPSSSSASTNVAIDLYMHNANFEFLHMNVLRDYLALELETSNILPSSSPAFDLERTIDDVVFLSFFVGNDFLPHMPALDIADEALDFLIYAYREQRRKWARTDPQPYLTNAGSLVSGLRLESFLSVIGTHETLYYDYKKQTLDIEQVRMYEARYGRNTTPSDQVLESKEAADRLRYREMLESSVTSASNSMHENDEIHGAFRSALTAKLQNSNDNKTLIAAEEGEDEDGLVSRMGNLLQYSISGNTTPSSGGQRDAVSSSSPEVMDDQDLKGRYYYDKFGFSPFDADKHMALRKAYIEGLVWNLKYYYEGCVSWEWFYPYHYGPMISDLVGLDDILKEISFDKEDMGEPLRPFEQLMACLPPSHASLLPEPYRGLMTDANSPIADFYPRTFFIDMNGKRLPWEAVILLPFIESKRLLRAAGTIEENLLSEQERQRNQHGETVVLSSDPSKLATESINGSDHLVTVVPFDSSPLHLKNPKKAPLFRPEIPDGVQHPLPGLPTLRDGSIASMWRKRIRINVHGAKSRYKTACLEMKNVLPEMIPIDMLASQLIGTVVYINYPHFIPAFVTAIADSKAIIRGQSRPRLWNSQEASNRKSHVTIVISNYVFGDQLVGTGGLTMAPGGTAMEDLEVLLYVRPMSGLKMTDDGTVVKVFAKFEVEVPLFVTSWVPLRQDERLTNVPALLEKDPYNACKVVITDASPNEHMRDSKQTRTSASLPNILKSVSLRGNRETNFRLSRAEATRALHSLAEFQPLLPRTGLLNGSAPFRQRNHHFPLQDLSSLRGSSTIIAPGEFSTRNGRIKVRACTHPQPRTGGARLTGYVTLVMVVLSFFPVLAEAANGLFGLSGIPAAPPVVHTEGIIFSNTHPNHSGSTCKPLEFLHGTTTLSFTFQGGIVLAVDSRASLGNFVGSKTTRKVLPIHSHLLGTMAGGAADCSFWIRKLRGEAGFHELTEGSRMSVARASRILSNWLYYNRGADLSVGTMIAGYDDEEEATPKIYYVDSTGMCIESDLFAVGSGSSFALGILDVERRFNMSVEEAIALGIKAIRHATFRDAGSGGFINVYVITRENGWKHVFTEDLARLSRQTESDGS